MTGLRFPVQRHQFFGKSNEMSNKIDELTQNIQERVQEIAYLMWESAGRQQGMAMEYWLAAEKEVLATMQSAATAMTRGYEEDGAAEKPKAAAAKAKPAAKPAAKRTTTTRRTKSTS